jgi:hypothetical protein
LATPQEKLKGIIPQALEEMVRCAASLELLSVGKKAELGAWIASRLMSPETNGGPWAWALGRLGARVPLSASVHRILSAETASAWADLLMSLDPRKHDTAAFSLALVTRKTGDRARDVDSTIRQKVLAHLTALSAPESWRRMVSEVVQLSQADEARVIGDTLPLGLSMSTP